MGQADTHQIMTAVGQARNAMLHVLESEGYPNGEVPILAWDNAQPGDPLASLRTSSGRRAPYRPFSRDSPQVTAQVAGLPTFPMPKSGLTAREHGPLIPVNEEFEHV